MHHPLYEYTLRPFSDKSRTELKFAFYVYLSPTTFVLRKLHPGDVCLLTAHEKSPVQAVVWPWPTSELTKDTIIQTSKAFQRLHGLKLGDKISITPTGDPIDDAKAIELSEVIDLSKDDQESIDQSQFKFWEWFLECPLTKAETIAPGMLLEGIERKGQKRAFRVEKVNDFCASNKLYRVSGATPPSIILRPKSDDEILKVANESLLITQEGIGGLSRQLDQLNENLEEYTASVEDFEYPPFYCPPRAGVLLHGPSGVGKTLILSKFARCKWASVHYLDSDLFHQSSGKVEQLVSKTFAEARKNQPSVVIIDELETLAGKSDQFDRGNEVSISRSLCNEFDRLGDSRILVIAATTSLGGLEEKLRRPGRFDLEIEIPVPDAHSRTEILKILSALPRNAPNADLETIGESTHGYVGADLKKLLQLSVRKAKTRIRSELRRSTSSPLNGDAQGHDQFPRTPIRIAATLSDLLAAQADIRPTAMSQVFLETPKVKFSDIGGNRAIKEALHEAISLPLTQAAIMSEIGIMPQKALLFYGPPGCSKTLIAQAIATESSLNFIAVKGAELLSMYVGESERAVREVFRKARAASPSVLFFDEIDAIAGSRSSGSGAVNSGGLNVLTTLLNELDGIEALKGVFVLAATNIPWSLDAALLRPGRFDEVFYVGPPDFEARVEILRIRLGKMAVEEDVDVEELASWMEGCSGADLTNLCQKAGYKAVKEIIAGEDGVRKIRRKHFEEAKGEVRGTITREMERRFEEFGSKSRGT